VLKIHAAGLVLAGFLLWGCSDAATPAAENEEIQDEQENGKNPILVLQDIELRQGEKGTEIWHLKAEEASMEKKDRKITVKKPVATYFSPPPDPDAFFISSVSGDIDQTNRMLRFFEGVRVIRQNAEVRGDLLLYNGTDRTITLPEGGSFSDGSMNGKAPLVRWRTAERLIEAEGGVTVVFSDGLKKNRASAPGGETESSFGEAR
jgi:hypothetical protein